LEALFGVPDVATILNSLFLAEMAAATVVPSAVLAVAGSPNLGVTAFQPSTAVEIQAVGIVHGCGDYDAAPPIVTVVDDGEVVN